MKILNGHQPDIPLAESVPYIHADSLRTVAQGPRSVAPQEELNRFRNLWKIVQTPFAQKGLRAKLLPDQPAQTVFMESGRN